MRLRQANIKKLQDPNQVFDVVVIGGGINGAVCAAALAAKGVKVALIDKGDFASGASSHSSNLIWGGIKYLENMEYLLVNKLCQSRNHLMKHYPSTVKEIRFLTTIAKGFRFPAIFVYIGTLIYWVLGRFFTKGPKLYSKKTLKDKAAIINTKNAVAGIEYSDAYLFDNDARFVFKFVRSSMDYGCIVVNYAKANNVVNNNELWTIQVEDQINNKQFNIRSRVVINTCGPWLDELNQKNQIATKHLHIFSKGVHLLVKQIDSVKRILTFFASDGRMFFVIPMGDRTCIGTTDTPAEQPNVVMTDADVNFILNNINNLLNLNPTLTKQDVIASRCGVRPLVVTDRNTEAVWTKLSRKHIIENLIEQKYINIFGGKLTDCLNVGNSIVKEVAKLGIAIPYPDYQWYGEDDDKIKERFFHQAKLMSLDSFTVQGSTEPLSHRLWRRYGEVALHLLEMIRQDSRQAELLMQETKYLRCELDYIAEYEMVTKLEDFLRRRSKIAQVEPLATINQSKGLLEVCKILFGKEAEQKYHEWLEQNPA